MRRFCLGKQDVTGLESQKVFWLPRRLFFNNYENKQPGVDDFMRVVMQKNFAAEIARRHIDNSAALVGRQSGFCHPIKKDL